MPKDLVPQVCPHQRAMLEHLTRRDAEEHSIPQDQIDFDPVSNRARSTFFDPYRRGKSRLAAMMKEAYLDAGYSVATVYSDGTVEIQGAEFARDITPRAGNGNDAGRDGGSLLPDSRDVTGAEHRDD